MQEFEQDGERKDADAELDALLATVMHPPGGEDVSVLSRAVLSEIAQEGARGDHVAGDVLSEPWPWAIGFTGLMGVGVALGYALSSGLLSEEVFAFVTLRELLALMGGL